MNRDFTELDPKVKNHILNTLECGHRCDLSAMGLQIAWRVVKLLVELVEIGIARHERGTRALVSLPFRLAGSARLAAPPNPIRLQVNGAEKSINIKLGTGHSEDARHRELLCANV